MNPVDYGKLASSASKEEKKEERKIAKKRVS
jgi:hypothetical protein